MNHTDLLSEQIKQCFGDSFPEGDDMGRFIEMVNNSYQNFETNNAMLDDPLALKTRELQMKYDALLEINEALNDFSHGVSHDLRTHAINVVSMVKMLKKHMAKGNIEKVEEIIGHLELTGTTFTNVINGFLEVSRVERSLTSDNSVMDLKTIFDIISEEFTPQLSEINGEINSNITLPFVDFPKERLLQVLRNLVGNSIKYRHAKKPLVIDISAQIKDDKKTITIKDNGKGIDMEKNQGQLFKMFNRFEVDETIEGSGIGLFMVKKILAKGGAKITIDSVYNEWTQCNLTFLK